MTDIRAASNGHGLDLVPIRQLVEDGIDIRFPLAPGDRVIVTASKETYSGRSFRYTKEEQPGNTEQRLVTRDRVSWCPPESPGWRVG